MDAIRTIDLTKAYNGRNVVSHCSLAIRRGEIYGFIGRNGAGKSTIMKMICGLVTPTSGRVEFYDEQGRAVQPATSDTSARDATHVGIGALIEQPGLLPEFGARDNLAIKARSLGIPLDRSTIDELLAAVQLTGADRAVRGFSMGMRQRLGIALALIGNPSILLLDEPLNGLDPRGIRDMRALLRQLRDERGMTIFISSHILGELEKIATRFGVINEGTLGAELTAEEVAEASAESLIVQTTTPRETATMIAEALPTCDVGLGEDGVIVVTGPFDRERVARLLHDSGAMVTELTVRRQDPEDYFLKLMERPTLTVDAPSAVPGVSSGGGVATYDASAATADVAPGVAPVTPIDDGVPLNRDVATYETPGDGGPFPSADGDPYGLFKKGR